MLGPRKVLHRLLALWLSLLPLSGSAYDALIAFGDSDTDTGNLPSSPPEYWDQRFSNGPLWIEHLAERLGLEYDPAANFAVSGNESADLGTQISRFWGPGEAQDVLYAIWAGSNDILNNLGAGTSDSVWEREIDRIVSSLVTSCDLLYQKGARQIVLFNIVDLTRLPAVHSAYSSGFRSYVLGKIRRCNARLADAVPGVVASHPGLQVHFIDLYSDMNYLLDRYTQLGFVNASVGVLNSTLADKSYNGPGANYVFWDGNHYTTKTHALLAQWIADRLPSSPPPRPSVVLTSPSPGDRFTAPAQISLAATVDAKGNAINRVEFLRDGSILAAISEPPYAFEWQSVPTGNYALAARVVDQLGRSAESGPVQVSVTAPAWSALPAPWQHADIGAPGQSGAAYLTPEDAFVVNGSGADIWGTEDSFHFAYRHFSGDCTLVARVTGIGNTDGFAKAGLMIRNDLSPGAANAAQFITPGFGTEFQVRLANGSTTTNSAGSPAKVPYWLKLELSDGEIRGYESADGQSWTLTGSSGSVAGGTNTIYAGLAVTSHNDSLLNASTFDNVRVEVAPPPVSPPSPAHLSVLLLSDGRLRITVSGSPGVPYVCQVSSDLQAWSAISTNVNSTGVIVLYEQTVKGAGQSFYRAVAMP